MILALNDVPSSRRRKIWKKRRTAARSYYWKLSLLRGGEVINTVLNQ